MTQKQTIDRRRGSHLNNFRKARTRTLIQLGSMIQKAGLLELFDLEPGQDLQKDPETLESAATLMGALMSLQDHLQGKDAKNALATSR